MFSKYRMAANAIMATSSADRLKATFQPVPAPYNNFSVSTNGGNIIQGQINKIRVCEINFPYCTPTVVDRQNDTMLVFELASELQANGSYYSTYSPVGVVLDPKFYAGTEIVAAINTQLSATVGNSLVAGYDTFSGSIYFANNSTWDATVGVTNRSYIIFPASRSVTDDNNLLVNPSLAWTVGLKNLFSQCSRLKEFNWIFDDPVNGPEAVTNTYYFAITPQNYPGPVAPGLPNFGALGVTQFNAVVGAMYSGLYTEYIDITSPQLCQAQYVRDGNTNQGANHRDLICRLYIADEASLDLIGNFGRPFQIHRQFRNPKIMKWTVDRSIDSIDLQLWDQYGNPIPNNPAQFITFLNAPPVVGPPAVNNLNLPLTSVGYSGGRDFNITFTVDEETPNTVGGY